MSIKITCCGCSHGRHSQLALPKGDVLVHTGDYSRGGSRGDAIDFLKWLEHQNFQEKIFIGGNHDAYSEEHPKEFAELVAKHAPSCHYIHEKAVEIMGFKWYGSNYTPFFNNWHFMAARGEAIQKHWDLIPSDTQILVTHGPAMGHLDLIIPEYAEGRDIHQGCGNLRMTIDQRLKSLKVHCHSHLHYEGSTSKTVNGVQYVNAAVVDDSYVLRPQEKIQTIEVFP